MAVQRMRTFTHLMPGEVQGCVGCHADRNYVVQANKKSPMAISREAEQLTEPEWGVTGFSYTQLVQPIFDKHCIKCHGRHDPAGGLELTGDKTDFFNMSYENLVRKGTPSVDFLNGNGPGSFDNKYTKWIPTYNGQEANILRIEPGEWGAKASLLGQIVESGHSNKEGRSRITLSRDEKLKIFLWMDLNVPYYAGSNSNYQSNRGCRQQIPKDFITIFEDVTARRCVSCHKHNNNKSVFSYPNQFALRVENPELNPIFLAPLNPEDGGSGKCEVIVFKDTMDQDYVRLLKTFDHLNKMLAIMPRMDMISQQ